MTHETRAQVEEAIASNIRAWRHIRKLDQAALAQRMQSLGFGWRPPTVSEVERNRRNVTAPELLALTLVFDAPVERLLAFPDEVPMFRWAEQ